ncbi:hypothetical protein AXX16_0548 [Serratia rubidaea]|nr:hypothetical protein AXX16_0548 [Serratia rubidaea]
MQNLGQVGIHTRSLARGEDHYTHCAVRHKQPDNSNFDRRK